MAEFARPFRLTYSDGLMEDEVLHGVQFPDGTCVLRLSSGLDAATGFEHLDQAKSDGVIIEWADGGEA